MDNYKIGVDGEGGIARVAYLLVMLDNTQSQKAITQLVGRVMRQPHAQLTNRQSLDQCYIYCHNAEVGAVVNQVKNGLEAEGLTGLDDDILGTAITEQADTVRKTVKRREQFRDEDIFLPRVLHTDGENWIQLDYQCHILPHIDWLAIEAPDPSASAPAGARRQSATVNLDDRPSVFHDDLELQIDKVVSKYPISLAIFPTLSRTQWHAARIVRQMIESLEEENHTEADIYDRRAYLAQVLREHVKNEVETQAEDVFRNKLNERDIRFDLETGQPNYRMAGSYEIQVGPNDRPLIRRDYEPVQLTLFERYSSASSTTNWKRISHIILMSSARCNGGIVWRRANRASIICKGGNEGVFTRILSRWLMGVLTKSAF